VASIDPTGTFQWAKVGVGGGRIACSAAGEIAVTDPPFSSVTPNHYVQKVDPSGSLLWEYDFPTGGNVYTIAADPKSSSVIAAGNLQGTLDFGSGVMVTASGADTFIVKFAP
jgi:hypothetical protein